MEGWISLHRKIMEHPDYFSEPFTRMGAWIDLLLIANHKTGYMRKRGIRVEVLRGQTAVSRERLAERWRWSAGKVTRFLNELEKDGQIVQQKSNVINCITICHYNDYQCNDFYYPGASGLADDPQKNDNLTPDGSQTDINNNTNKEDKGDNSTHTVNFDDNIFLTRARNFLNWLDENYPSIQEMREPFTLNQALKIVRKFEPEDVGRIVAALHNKGSTDFVSAYATFCSFADNDRVLKERREKGLKLYSYKEMTEFVTSHRAAQSDFLPIEKNGIRFYMLKADKMRRGDHGGV